MSRWEFGAPVVAFICMSMVLWVATKAEGADFFQAITWYRWDSDLYGQIAQTGYDVYRCAPVVGGVHVHQWCGDSAWFPGYPAVTAVLHDLGLPVVGASVLVSWVFDLLTLVVLWNAFLRAAPSPHRYLGLAFATFCPGGIYLRAAFPISAATFFMVLWLFALREQRWLWAGIAGGCATFVYPTTLVLIPLSLGWILWTAAGPIRRRGGSALLCSGLIGLGTLVALGVIALGDHRLNGFFLNQSDYKHGFHEPFANLWPMYRGAFAHLGGTFGNLTTIEDIDVLMTAGVVAAMTFGVAGLALRRRATRWDCLLVCFAVFLWLFPATQAGVSYYRDDALVLVPGAVLLTRMRAEWSFLIAAASLSVFPFLASMFFTGGVI